jgi:hypothetical protein
MPESTIPARVAQAAIDPASDPSLHYCIGLAGHIIRAFPDRLTRSSWKAVLGPDTPDPVDIQTVAITWLLPNVAAQARLSSLVEYSPSKWLLEQEMEARFAWHPGDLTPEGITDNVFHFAANRNLKGMCLSGGGIRSATFNLGILQGLAGQKKLGKIDYLSSISGGGYIHQFLSSWILCEDIDKVQEQLSPIPGQSTRSQWPEPIRWLRRYSNYLTPKRGLLTADTWVAVSVWLRNTILNQIVLVAATLCVLLLPHIPFLWKFNAEVQLQTPATGELGPAVVTVVLFLIAVSQMLVALRKSHDPHETPACAPAPDVAPAELGPNKRIGYGGRRIFFSILVPTFAALFVVSPYLYRTSFPSLVLKPAARCELPASGIPLLVQQLHTLAAAPQAPACKLPPPKPATSNFYENASEWFNHYKLPFWSPLGASHQYVLMAFLFGIGALVFSLFWATSRLAPMWYRLLAVGAAIAVALFTALLLLHLARVFLMLSAIVFSYSTLINISITFVPILLLCVIFITMDIAIGTLGRSVRDSSREWLARVRSLSFLAGFAWVAVVGCSLLGPVIVALLLHAHRWKLLTTAMTGWLGTSIGSLIVGKSTATKGDSDNSSGKPSPLEIFIAIGPAVFLAGLMVILAWVAQFALHLFPGTPALLIMIAATSTLAAFLSWRVDINEFSLHAFYRDRIARCYGGATNPDRYPNAFTGLANGDTQLHLASLLPAKFGKGASSLWGKQTAPRYQGPFPIFGATLNLTFGADLATQERKASAFAFTPLYCGYDIGWTEGNNSNIQLNGFTPTNSYAYRNGGPHVATVVAASGAALSPNDGFHTSPAMSFLLTVFNLRLGWWLPNPRNLHTRRGDKLLSATPTFGLPYLLGELFGQVSDNAKYVSISDGGHFENMGLYELVRRRCKTIIICDAEQDKDFVFEGIGMAIRKCRIDFGAEIKFGISESLDGTEKSPQAATTDTTISPDVDKKAAHIDPGPQKKLHDIDHIVPGEDGYSKCAYAIGQIFYAAQPTPGDPNPVPVVGDVLYLKSTLTGKEPADIRNYKRQHPSFPGDSTLNQWFTESQFESYRRLGQFIAEDATVKAWLDKHLVERVNVPGFNYA